MAKKNIPGEARSRLQEPARAGPNRQPGSSARSGPRKATASAAAASAGSASSRSTYAGPASPETASTGSASATGAAWPPGAAHGPDAPKVIADAVRLGYQVVGDNLRHGRDVADRFSAGAYRPRDVRDDVGQLSSRLMQLARDLGTVGFDLLGAVLRDPTLHEALRPNPAPPHGNLRAEAPRQVNVGCTIKGNSKATAEPVVLSKPPRPSPLIVAGLHSPDPSRPPISNISFLASDDGVSIIATITVPPDQPPGTYSGVVCDEKTHTPLGSMTVRVAG